MKRLFYLFVLMSIAVTSAKAKTEKLFIQGAVGKLAAVIQTPEMGVSKKCPMVMLLHGFGGNKDGAIEKMIASKLEQAGIASIRFDFNGHGESEGEFQNMTVPNEIEDAKMVYAYVSALPYVSKVAVSGHSQGGVVTSMLAGELGKAKIACVVLMAPAAVLREDAIRGNTMGKMYNPLDPPEYVELFGSMKLGRNYITTAFSLPIYETAAKYTGPACIIHGTGDRVVPYTYGERYHEIWKGSELHILPAFDHGFSQDLNKATDIAVTYLVSQLKN
jgi:pimeloyl-ACP methyl ester carboxylesterase